MRRYPMRYMVEYVPVNYVRFVAVLKRRFFFFSVAHTAHECRESWKRRPDDSSTRWPCTRKRPPGWPTWAITASYRSTRPCPLAPSSSSGPGSTRIQVITKMTADGGSQGIFMVVHLSYRSFCRHSKRVLHKTNRVSWLNVHIYKIFSMLQNRKSCANNRSWH